MTPWKTNNHKFRNIVEIDNIYMETYESYPIPSGNNRIMLNSLITGKDSSVTEEMG